jgi:hypothetical protein
VIDGAGAGLVAADGLAMHQNERRTRLLRAVGEGVKQGENAGVGERDSQSNRSRDSEANHKGNQQTSQVRPTFPRLCFSIAAANQRFAFRLTESIAYSAGRRKRFVRPVRSTVPALTLAAVYK